MESIPTVLSYRACLYDNRPCGAEDPSVFLYLRPDLQGRQSAGRSLPTLLESFFYLMLKAVDEGELTETGMSLLQVSVGPLRTAVRGE